MEIEINNKIYPLFIEKKYIKNMYLRIKPDGIHVSANILVSHRQIVDFIMSNASSIEKNYERINKKEEKKEEFYYLGNKYDVVILNTVSKIQICDNTVYVKNKSYLKTFLENEAEEIFNARVKYCYNLFEERIPFPKVMVWKMKRKWGYCNKREKLVKLNFDLIHYSINVIDYVIIHELCHFIEFNHSTNFWKLVKKYKPDYKECQSILKEE